MLLFYLPTTSPGSAVEAAGMLAGSGVSLPAGGMECSAADVEVKVAPPAVSPWMVATTAAAVPAVARGWLPLV